MKIIGIIQVYNELPENLPRAVRSARRLCQEMIGYDDGSTDGSGAWMDANLDHVIHGERNEWNMELLHKHLMLEEAKRRGADWIFWIDCDEELSPPALAAIPRCIDGDAEMTGIGIPEMHLWRTQTHYRVDAGFGRSGFLRLWRVTPALRYSDEQIFGRTLHQWQFPPSARERMGGLAQPSPEIGVVGEPMLHYSWDSPAKITAKYERYKAMGQEGWNLERLKDSDYAELIPARPEWFWPKE